MARLSGPPLPQAFTGLDFRFTLCNDAMTRLLGLPAEQLIGRLVDDFVSVDGPGSRELELLTRGSIEHLSYEGMLVPADGLPVRVLVVASLMRDEVGEPRAVTAHFVDLSAQKVLSEDRPGATNKRDDDDVGYRRIVETAPVGIWVTSPTGETLHVNQTMADMLGRPVDEVAVPAVDLLEEKRAAAMARSPEDGRSRDVSEYEVDYHHPDGGTRRHHVHRSPLFDGDQRYVGSVAIVSDVTHARDLHDQLRRNALYDDLTGLPNQTLLEDRLSQAKGRRERGASSSITALVLEIDASSTVDAERGDSNGDAALAELAGRLKTECRPGDTVARSADDQFVILCEDLDAQQGLAMARRQLRQLDRPFSVGKGDLHLTACVGIASSPPCPADHVMEAARAASETARAKGRGVVEIFDGGQTTAARKVSSSTSDLEEVLVNERLALRYQPIVELSTGRLLGLEALVWREDATRGPASQAHLVTVAERSGLSAQLDAWALRTATTALADLHTRNLIPDNVYMAVNVSPQHLLSGELEHAVDEALAATGLPPGRLSLELSEIALPHDASPAFQTLDGITRRGVTLTLDHFGTGYSGVASLQEPRFARVKIDSTFVSRLPDDVDDLALVTSVLEMSRAAGVSAVAEGVMSAEQAELLTRLDCHAAQGGLYGEPVALPLLQQRLASTTASGGRHPVPSSPPAESTANGARSAGRPSRENGLHRLLALHQEGASLRTIAAALNSEGFRTPVGSRWHPTSVASAIADQQVPSLSTGSRS